MDFASVLTSGPFSPELAHHAGQVLRHPVAQSGPLGFGEPKPSQQRRAPGTSPAAPSR